MATDTLYIGGSLENGQITGYALAYGPGDSSELSYVQSLSPDGNELACDELYVTLRCRKDSLSLSSPFLTVDGKAFHTAGGPLLFPHDAPGMEDRIITGYVTFQTTGGETFLTSDGQTFLVPETQALSDFFLSLFQNFGRDTPVWLRRQNDDGSERLEKYYWKSMVRTGKYDYDLTAQSPFGRLTSAFDGDLYTGQTLPEVLFSLLVPDGTHAIVPYTVDAALHGIRVYGWLPVQSRREAVHSLALALGFVLRRDSQQDLLFTLPPETPSNLPDSAIFTGGSVDYRMGTTYARFDVTEYGFLQTETDQEATLYDNTDGSTPTADYLRVLFDNAPVYDLTPSDGLTVHSATANTAVVSGTGTLTGKPYTVTQSTVSLAGDSRADPEQVFSLTDLPLLNMLNGEIVAEKLRASFNAPAVVEMDFLRTTQRPGDLFQFIDPWDTPRTGILTALDGKITALDRVTGSFLCGYAHHYGNAWDSVRVFSSSTTFPVGDDLDGQTALVVLIGGGQGGSSGAHGSDKTASGGTHGLPGNGGKVAVVKIPLRKGQSWTVTIGSGGAGGIPSAESSTTPPDTMTVYVAPTGNRWHLNPNCGNGTYTPTTYAVALARGLSPCENCVTDNAPYYLSNPGAEGTPSTVRTGGKTYSSASGASIALGYQDIINGNRYAQIGPDFGVDGGDATTAKEDKNSASYTDITVYSVASPLGDGQSWDSGAVGSGQYKSRSGDNFTDTRWAFGGFGGGAAVGGNGSPGTDGTVETDVSGATGGNGGNGADASPLFPVNPTPYGSGGSGGHGGGAGGPGGASYYRESGDGGSSERQTGSGTYGSGGSGSAGQPGQPGCVLLYYRATP